MVLKFQFYWDREQIIYVNSVPNNKNRSFMAVGRFVTVFVYFVSVESCCEKMNNLLSFCPDFNHMLWGLNAQPIRSS